MDKWKKYFIENNIKIDDLEVDLAADSDATGAGIGGVESYFEPSSTLSEDCPSSSSFVRAPLEDRSKYEKLTSNLDDVSSDDSANGN